MSIYGGPAIETDDLKLCMDAANKKSITNQDLDIEYLIVAGGGGGGGVIGGGGGAGGLLNGFTTATIANGDYTVVVGAGGAGGTGWNTNSQDGKVGGDSSAFSVTTNGGGGGVHHGGATSVTTKNGGSGGGGALAYSGAGGTGVSGQGNNGGNNGNGNLGAGGGGAGSVGGNASGTLGGAGGLGRYFGNKFGSVGYNGWFADGGAGGVRGYAGTSVRSASNGGGYGTSNTVTAGSGAANTGSGGGGGGYSASSTSRVAGNGGSGVVIIKYLGPQKAAGGDTVFNYQGYTVHVFTSSGTFTVGEAWGDLTKNNFKTKLINGPVLNRNIANGVVYFDGTNQYMRPNVSHSYLASSTFSLFFKALSVNVQSNAATHRIATLGGYRHNGGYSSPTLGFLMLRSTNNGSTYFLGSSVITASQAYRHVNTSSGSISLNQWYYAALVKDVENGVLKIYINGQPIASVTFDTATYAQWTSAGSYIGANVLDIGKSSGSANQGYGNDYFHGYMSNIRLYGKVLTDAQILKNYNALKGRFGL